MVLMKAEYDLSKAKRAKNVPHLAKLQTENATGKTRVTMYLNGGNKRSALHRMLVVHIRRNARWLLRPTRADCFAGDIHENEFCRLRS
jgi:hypothetical protein